MSKNKLIIAVIFVVAVVVAVVWNISDGSFSGQKDALQVIPDNAALVIEIDNLGDLFKQDLSESKIWNKLNDIDVVSKLTNFVTERDKHISSDKSFSELVWNSPVTIALFADSITDVETVAILNTVKKISIDRIRELIESGISNEYRILDLPSFKKGIKIVNTETSIDQYIVQKGKLIIYTQSLQLLNKIINPDNGNLPLSTDSLFMSVKKTGGTKAKARVFFNFSELN